MTLPRARSVLSRLRASTRLATLVLMVFALKIGIAAACVGHDLRDAGLIPADSHNELVTDVPAHNAGDETSSTVSGHAEACHHGGTHQATDLARIELAVLLMTRDDLDAPLAEPSFWPVPTSLLRPPIA